MYVSVQQASIIFVIVRVKQITENKKWYDYCTDKDLALNWEWYIIV